MYTIEFLDGTTFQGGEPNTSLWAEIPHKPIKSLSYSFTPILTYLFTDFEAYNHTVERIKGLNTDVDIISSVIIMGRVKNRVYQVMLDRDGGVFQMVVPFGQEYSPTRKYSEEGKFIGWLNGKALTGWCEGLMGGEPKLRKV